MVWGAFCSTTKFDLVFIPSKAKVDAVTYVETVIEPCLVSFWHKCWEEYGWAKVIKDGVLGHKVWLLLRFLFFIYCLLCIRVNQSSRRI